MHNYYLVRIINSLFLVLFAALTEITVARVVSWVLLHVVWRQSDVSEKQMAMELQTRR
jgi:hypothetical protein